MEKKWILTLSKYEVEVTAESEQEAITKATEELYEDTLLDWNVEEGECAECDGTGEVSTDESDGEGHIMRGVGTETCLCQK